MTSCFFFLSGCAWVCVCAPMPFLMPLINVLQSAQMFFFHLKQRWRRIRYPLRQHIAHTSIGEAIIISFEITTRANWRFIPCEIMKKFFSVLYAHFPLPQSSHDFEHIFGHHESTRLNNMVVAMKACHSQIFVVANIQENGIQQNVRGCTRLGNCPPFPIHKRRVIEIDRQIMGSPLSIFRDNIINKRNWQFLTWNITTGLLHEPIQQDSNAFCHHSHICHFSPETTPLDWLIPPEQARSFAFRSGCPQAVIWLKNEYAF